jgi:ABC-type lipoprotein release transport system permease subunit
MRRDRTRAWPRIAIITFISATVILAILAVAASLVPAWRATRVDPLTALRTE